MLDSGNPDRELSLLVTSPTPGVFDDVSVEEGGRIEFRLPAEDTLQLGCTRFLTAVRSRGDLPYGREASAVLAVVEALERSCAAGGSPESIAPKLARHEQNVIAFRSP